MHVSSSIDFEGLTPAHIQQLPACRERWTRAKLATEPADRAASEIGVRLSYKAAGFAPPDIEWCKGPLEIRHRWGRGRLAPSTGRNIRVELVDAVRERVTRAVRVKIGSQAWLGLLDGMRTPAAASTSTAIERTVRIAVERKRQPVSAYLLLFGATLARLQNPITSWPTFNRSGFCPATLDWLGACDLLRHVCGLKQETDCLQGHWLLAANTGWVLPHQHVCWVSERPTVIGRDTSGRLHSAAGPALGFADGWSAYFWKGVRVAPEVIERSEEITLEAIERQHDIFVRRCMIEIMTPSRFLAMGGAKKIHQDETGILWRRNWLSGDSWAAVEVCNATPEPDGSYRRYILQVPPEVTSARAAVAWSYGMTEQEYSRLSVRT